LAAANGLFYADQLLGFSIIRLDEQLCEEQLPNLWPKLQETVEHLIATSKTELPSDPTAFMIFYAGIRAVFDFVNSDISKLQIRTNQESGKLGAPIFSTSGSLLGLVCRSGVPVFRSDVEKVLSTAIFVPLTEIKVVSSSIAFRLKCRPLVEPGFGISCYNATVFYCVLIRLVIILSTLASIQFTVFIPSFIILSTQYSVIFFCP
jgi:hypothetical protein